MDDSYKNQRKTNRLLSRKKEEKDRRIKEIKAVNVKHLEKEKKEYEKESSKTLQGGDEKAKRSMKLYEKLFTQNEYDPHVTDGRNQAKYEQGKYGSLGRYRDQPKYGDQAKTADDGKMDQHPEDTDAPPQREWLPREEFLKLKQEKDKKRAEKRKFKSLYGRKTTKGQPIMKHRINHLLAKIKSGAKL